MKLDVLLMGDVIEFSDHLLDLPMVKLLHLIIFKLSFISKYTMFYTTDVATQSAQTTEKYRHFRHCQVELIGL